MVFGASKRHPMNSSRILVVDDDPSLSGLVRLFLEQTMRFEVRVENRPTLALSAAREFRPQVILLDVEMPGKNGGEVAREMESEPALSGVPILFLTSLVSHAEAGDCELVRGGKRYLAKPVSPSVLIAAVDSMLSSKVLAH
jgi:DNA-binding response OmpR family regulator